VQKQSAERTLSNLLQRFRGFAEKKHATPAQISLAWLLAQKPFIVPIPGTRNIDHLNENLGAINVQLTPADLREIDAAVSKIKVHGGRMNAVTAVALLIVVLAASTPQLRGAAANTLEAAAFHLDDSRSVVMEGTLLCRDCQLKKEYGYRAMCPLKGHHGTLQTKDGKIWNILDGDVSEDLIHNSALLGRTVRIHGRCFRRASSIEVDKYEVL
jgi:Aldo/keto reductase family